MRLHHTSANRFQALGVIAEVINLTSHLPENPAIIDIDHAKKYNYCDTTISYNNKMKAENTHSLLRHRISFQP